MMAPKPPKSRVLAEKMEDRTMSMNIHIKAVAKATVNKTGEEFDHAVYLPVRQTPTEVTYRILEAENKIEEYENYVLSNSIDEEEPVFAEDDLFGEGDPIEYKTVNIGKEHLAELNHDINHYINKGYEIVFEVM